jgi:hypothetical protein
MKINKYVALVASLTLVSVAIGAESTRNKLDTIVVKKLGIERGFTMEEVIEALSDAAGGRVNFLYFPALEVKDPVNPAPPPPLPSGLPAQLPAIGNVNGIPQAPMRLDPVSGLPAPLPILGNPLTKLENEPKIRGVRLKLKDVSLRQAVDIVSMSFDKPMQTVVMDFGVIFIPRKNPTPLFNRTYRINPSRLNNIK